MTQAQNPNAIGSTVPVWAGSATVGPIIPSSSVITPATLAASQDDYNPAGLTDKTAVIRQAASANISLTGLIAPTTDKLLYLINISAANTITLSNQDAGSAAANRFLIAGGDLILQPNASATLFYDTASSAWRVV